jgi:hypothetical protein
MVDAAPASRRARAAIALAIGIVSFCIYRFEPTGAWSCDPVNVAGVTRVGVKGRTYFNLSSTSTPGKHYTVPFNGDFPEEYIGPAALWIKHGRLTGFSHYRLTGRCVDEPVE